MGERTVRLRVVELDDDEGPAPDRSDTDGAPHERPSAIPHVLPGLRVVAVTSFAGGVGKTTLAVEIATLVASRARIRSLEGAEQAVRVLVLDAARLASAVGLRLGLDPAALSAVPEPSDLARSVRRRRSRRADPLGRRRRSPSRPTRSSPSATGRPTQASRRLRRRRGRRAPRGRPARRVSPAGGRPRRRPRRRPPPADRPGRRRPGRRPPDARVAARRVPARDRAPRPGDGPQARDRRQRRRRRHRDRPARARGRRPAARADRRGSGLHRRGRPRRARLVDRARAGRTSSPVVARAAWPLLGGCARRARRAGARCCAPVRDAMPGTRRQPMSDRRQRRVRPMRPALGGDPGHGPADARRAPGARGPQPVRARPPSRRRLLRRTIGEILAEPELDLDTSPALVAAVEAAVCGLGPLQPLVDDPLIGDILVNGPGEIFVERVGPPRADRPSRSDPRARSSRSASGSPPSPGASCRSPTRSSMPGCPTARRVNAVIPPVGGPYLSIRKFNRLRLDLVPGGRHGRSWVAEGGLDPGDGRASSPASCARARTSSWRARPAPARRRSCAR